MKNLKGRYKEMKAADLMLNDWVQVYDMDCSWERHQIAVIDPAVVVFKDGFDEVNIGNIEPIVLTSEILEKNGVCRKGAIIQLVDDLVKVYVTVRNESEHNFLIGITGGYGNGKILFTKSIEYVHELQHALRMCKIDKEIEL